MYQSDEGRFYESRIRYKVIVHLGLNVSSSAHNYGYIHNMVNGGNVMTAIWVFIIYLCVSSKHIVSACDIH